MNPMGLHPCSHHHPVQAFHEISDDKFISPEARMNINFVSQGLRRTAGVSGFLCLGRLFQGQPNEAALCI